MDVKKAPQGAFFFGCLPFVGAHPVRDHGITAL
jgi:hypothetical protein